MALTKIKLDDVDPKATPVLADSFLMSDSEDDGRGKLVTGTALQALIAEDLGGSNGFETVANKSELQAAWGNGHRFINLDATGIYNFESTDTPLLSEGEPVWIRGNGATITTTTSNTIFGLAGGHENIQSVSLISYADGITTITVSDSSLYARSDVIFLRSSVDYLQSDTSKLSGEYLVVFDAPTATTIEVIGKLRYAYTPSGSDVQVAKINPAKIIIEDLHIEHIGTDEGAFTVDVFKGLICLQAAVNPIVRNISVGFSWNTSIVIQGCRGARVENITTRYGPNYTTNDWQPSNLCYSVAFSNSAYCIADGGLYGHGRHGTDYFTSGTYYTDLSPSSLLGAGGCYENKTINWHGHGGTMAPFSTHDGVEDIDYINCSSSGLITGATFAFRGWRIRAINCRTYGGEWGAITFVHYAENATSKGCEFINFTSVNPTGGMFQFKAGSCDNSIVNARLIIDETTPTLLWPIYIRDNSGGAQYVSGFDIIGTGSIPSSIIAGIAGYESVTNPSQLFIDRLRVIFDDATTSIPRWIYAYASPSTLLLRMSNVDAIARNGDPIGITAVATTAVLHPDSMFSGTSMPAGELTNANRFGVFGNEVWLHGGPSTQAQPNGSAYLGYRAGRAITTGSRNTGIGGGALLAATTARYNVAIGNSAGDSITTGQYCTLAGIGSDVSSASAINAIGIGANVIADGYTGTGPGDYSGSFALGSATNPVAVMGDGSLPSTAGAAVGYMRIKLNGTYYRIQLLAES